MQAGPSIAELAEAVHAATEPPPPPPHTHKRELETLRHNIELFVDGVMMEDQYPLAALLNESFTMEMLDLLFKRMTAKLRMILFSRAKTHEFLSIALDPSQPRHTRALATAFVVVGGAAANTVACRDGDHYVCREFWDSIFGSLQKEAQASALAAASTPTPTPIAKSNPTLATTDITPTEPTTLPPTLPTTETPATTGGDEAAVAELVELIQVEINDIEKYGAKSHQRSVVLQEALNKKNAEKNGAEEGDDDDHHSLPDMDTDHRLSVLEEKDSPKVLSPTSAANDSNDSDDTDDFNSSVLPVVGLYSEDTANFSSQLLRYFAIKGQRGACILDYLAQHPPLVELLMANIGHDDTRTMLLHVVYSDHSDAAIESLFKMRLMDRLIQLLVSFGPPRNTFERDRVENSFLLLREIIHAPYLTGRGVAISAKTIPLDKVTGQDEYVSICGASREMANSSLRKYTSRKVRRIVHLFIQQNQIRIEQLFSQMIQELTFWNSQVARDRARRDSLANLESLESLSLVGMGHPRPVGTATLTHLFELTETVDFSEEHTKKAGPNAAAVTTVGIDCLNFMCSTHLVRTGKLLVKKKLRNEIQPCHVAVNCMMGLRITSIRKEDKSHATPTAALDSAFVHTTGNQIHITLDEIDRVASSDWHKFGFVVTVKKRVVVNGDASFSSEHVTTSEEFFAAASDEEKQSWIKLLQQVIDGDLTALEIFCSDDWRSNVREYRQLRECLITSMERKGHELMAFLKQVLVLDQRRASGFHLWTIVKFLNAVLSNESKRLDQMFVSSQLLRVLMVCYEKYPMMNLLLGEITKMMLFVLGDFKNKRSRRCPIIGKLLNSQEPDAKLLPLLTTAFVGTEGGKTSPFAGTDTLSELKLLMESIMLCYRDPKSRSQERVQAVLKEDPKWQVLIQAVEQEIAKNPTRRITSVPVPPSSEGKSGASKMTKVDAIIAAAPTQPAFQEHIINQITRPCYFSAHGFGSSFLLGDGCAFGYMFKQRHGSGTGGAWQKVLLVYEYVSYKLWYFYPSEVDETHHIQWKWIVPVGVRGRYTHGHDESHSSVGHHGLFVTAYDQHHEGTSSLIHHHDTPAGTRELHFSVTKLEDRDQWKQVLAKAAAEIQQLARDYVAMKAKLKKPDKKTITHCQDPSCQQPFKLLRRPHACKRCGQWFCSKCSMQRLAIPQFGLMHAVRHCRACFEAAGGLEATKEPTKLFGPANKSGSSSNNNTNSANKNGSAANTNTNKTNGQSANSNGKTTNTNGSNSKNPNGLRVDTSASEPHKPYSNHELYELAHGMVSPRSMLAMRRRMTRLDSIDSPTSGYQVDELNGSVVTLVKKEPRHFFGDDNGDDSNELSPYGSPPPASYLLPLKEDTRG